MDSTGHVQWEKTYSGFSESSIGSCGAAVKQMTNGDYIMVGSSGNEYRDLLLICIDSAGTLKWHKKYGDSGDDYATNFLVMSNGGFLIGGVSCVGTNLKGDIRILQTDKNGDTLCTRKYGGRWGDILEGMTALADGTFLITGSMRVSENGVFCACVMKLGVDNGTVASIRKQIEAISCTQTLRSLVFRGQSSERFIINKMESNKTTRLFDIQGRSIVNFSKLTNAGVLLKRTIKK